MDEDVASPWLTLVAVGGWVTLAGAVAGGVVLLLLAQPGLAVMTAVGGLLLGCWLLAWCAIARVQIAGARAAELAAAELAMLRRQGRAG
jgi:hypothetical protein